MPKRHISLVKNGKDVLFGVMAKQFSDFYWAQQDRNEKIEYRVNLEHWLDAGETIASTSETSPGIAVSKTINSTSVDYTIEGQGYLDAIITTSSGAKKSFRIEIVDTELHWGHGLYKRYGGNYGW